ncbi:potassium-transporting ATPase subunit KdpC [Ramlibacter sp. G-1-2-2]|uniref:Potassium-transporting ATPase KdpC subunit n=1 Tax=Ramlibacter agri TaxID=2728837 RepID=A0A848H3D1_9BURK|nr:potassium-transporting ATPase subunit KdpC [Ramlibacter agri]NML44222.1 potassium-transporting ATPase subunit KdpC [Ramlibacter agri]
MDKESILRPTLVLFAALTLLVGVAYPVVVTGTAQAAFPRQAAGSLVRVNGQLVGSDLIGQDFHDARHFWGRPSATADQPYNGLASGGSNLGPLNPALVEAVKARVAALRAADPGNTAPVPADPVTASGSGLDPHISPAAARYQVARVARARGLPVDKVAALVEQNIEQPWLGLIGEPVVNVLRLNLALDNL